MRQHKRKLLIALSIIVFLVISCFGLWSYGGLVYSLTRWELARPTIYRMQVKTEQGAGIWQWEVVVENNKIQSVTQLDSDSIDSFLTEEDLTVNRLISLITKYCYEQPDECIFHVDETYHYPTVWASSSRSIRIDSFEACSTVDECIRPLEELD